MNTTAFFLTQSQLRERGWTPALIKKFLGTPDAERTNPHYRSAAPMLLYALSRVEEVEQQEDWQEAAKKAAERSQTGKSIADRKAAELIQAAEQLPITVTRLPLDILLSRTIGSYNAFHEEMYCERGHEYQPANKHSHPSFLERITVNYIRHDLTEYDTHLEEVAGRIGVDEAKQVIRRRVYEEMAAIYPEYSEECKRQWLARHGQEAQA